MSEMVERVARAICVAHGVNPDAPTPVFETFRDSFGGFAAMQTGRTEPSWHREKKAARAAIEAMREPTEEMLAAGQWTISDNLTVSVCVENNRKAREIWQSMIDAALPPHKPQP